MLENLTLKNLSAGFNGLNVFSGLNGTFYAGKPNIIIGRAGIGKSTLLKTIAGFKKAGNGKIMLGDEIFRPEGKVSLAFQNPENLFFNPTALEEAGYALKMASLETSLIHEKTCQWLQRWGLDPQIVGNRHPFELSGGEKRRLALAACTISAPPVILLDEPLAGIDHSGQQQLNELIKSLCKDHVVIVVTHEPEAFLAEAASVLFLRSESSEWFNGNSFLHRALAEPGFFPLPDWYTRLIKPFCDNVKLPGIDPYEVFTYLKSQDYIDAD